MRTGADAILLIAALLDEREMRRFPGTGRRFSHGGSGGGGTTAAELEPALASGAEIVGINNRDLRTFEVTLETSLRLSEKIPASVVKISESGIHSRECAALTGRGVSRRS